MNLASFKEFILKIKKLKTPDVNQNGYHKNVLTKERIGALFLYPIDYTPEDCLSCDGYLLEISDYEALHTIIGIKFNQQDDPSGTFRIPDYNITGKFLQPGTTAGLQIEAGLPNITGVIGTGNWGLSTGQTLSGAFYSGGGKTYGVYGQGGGQQCNFAASNSNPIYGASPTVQPPSQLVHVCIKYR